MGNGENIIDKNVSASRRQIYRVQISSGNYVTAGHGISLNIICTLKRAQIPNPGSWNICHNPDQNEYECAIVLGLIDAW